MTLRPGKCYSEPRSKLFGKRMAERRTQWNFFMAEDGGWGWKVVRPDGTELTSQRNFPTLKECTADASQNGYVVWKSDEERRREAAAR
jgi:hypothetical protein